MLRACTKHITRAWLEEPASAEQPEWSNDLNWPWVTLRSTGWAWLRLGYRHQLQLTQGHTRHTGHLVTAGAADGGDPEDGGGVGTERGAVVSCQCSPQLPPLSATGAINRRHRGEKGERDAGKGNM